MSIKHTPNVAFLFPGQGSQYVGMGQDLYGADPAVRDLFDEAETLLEFPLKQICFEGPEEVLKQTRYTQPAIFVHSLAIDLLLRRQGRKPYSRPILTARGKLLSPAACRPCTGQWNWPKKAGQRS